MVFLARLDIARRCDQPEIDRSAVDAQRIRFDQPVVAVEIAQILLVPLGGQVGHITVPVEQVEGRIVLAQQVIVDHVVPDQVGAAQQVEGRRHVPPVEIAIGGHRLDHAELRIVDEIEQLARFLEIHLRGEEGRARDLVLLAAAVEQRKRGRQRGPRHAIADGVDRGHVQPRADMVDRIDLRADVIVPHHVAHACIGRFPADHEHRHALFDRPAHEALLRVEVEDIEAVDPRREDHQRRFHHRVGGRRILDQLVERGFVHDLARRHRDVLAEHESAVVGVAQLPAPQVGKQVLHAAHQIVAARLQRPLHHHRVEQREIGRAGRLGDRPGGEAQLFAFLVRQALHAVDHLGNAFGEKQIGLVDQRIGRVRAPARVGEAPVRTRQVGFALGHRLPLGAEPVLSEHLLPQRHAFLHQRLLPRRIGERHLAVPVIGHAHPARRIEIGGEGLRIAQLLGLVFEPHALQLRPDFGPVLHVFGFQRRAGGRFGQRREQRPREFGRGFEHVREGIGAVVGHHRSCLLPSVCWGDDRIFRRRMHACRLHLHDE